MLGLNKELIACTPLFVAMIRKRLLQTTLFAFVAVNAIAYGLAHTLTHHKSPGQIGLGVPRPVNSKSPSDVGLNYDTQRIPVHQTEWLESWWIPAPSSNPKGTVLLFPGSGGSMGRQLLAPAKAFHNLNYDALMIDFRGVGRSSGHTKTLGYREGQDVAAALQYVRLRHRKTPIVLYGVSMGSAAILSAIALEKIKPDGIILELPYNRLSDAVKIRFRELKVPEFPLAGLMVFWGGLQHGFNGFALNPIDYAKQVRCPALVLQGEKDRWIKVADIKALVQNLKGPKQLIVFPTAGHHVLVTKDKERWYRHTETFLNGLNLQN